MAVRERKFTVQFGPAGRGKKNRRLPVQMQRSAIRTRNGDDLMVLDAILTNAQVEVVAVVDPQARTDAAGQEMLPGVSTAKCKPLKATCDIKGFSVRETVCRFTVLFPSEIAAEKLDCFSFQGGTLTLKRIGDAVSEDVPEEEGPEAE